MKVEIEVNNSTDPKAQFVTWTPCPCRIRVTDPTGVTASTVNLRIAATAAAAGGEVVFRAGTSGAFSATLTLQVPTSGSTVPFYAAGRFGRASTRSGDATIQARMGTTSVGTADVMVRIRKNANTLTNDERDRFVAAFAQLNNQGAGRFSDFRLMHTDESSPQAHFAAGFLPWHRAYLLDLERELQAIDPSVALPYWRFDQPAPKLFNRDFFGVSDSLGTVQFSAGNPLRFWTTDGVQGINRRPFFSTSTGRPGVRTEAQTLALGGGGNLYRLFRNLEGNPHGTAHTSFGGAISSIGTAARDPLFFLLHCNVDRLWAKWQRQFGRANPAQASAYDSNPDNPVGHNLPDSMWPWNGIVGGDRPSTAPGGALASSSAVSAPGPQPRVQDCVDYQGSVSAASRLGFDYDDVPFA